MITFLNPEDNSSPKIKKGLFMAKKHDLSDKKFTVCHAPLPLPYAKFVPRLQPRP
jgi:hypothetical protein